MKRISVLFFPFLCSTHLSASWADEALARLTLEQKIGQCFMVATCAAPQHNKNFLESQPYNLDPSYVAWLIEQYHIGGIIYLGMSSQQDIFDASIHFQQLSTIPLLIGLDAEWGLSMRTFDGMRFPRAMTLGALTNTNLIYECARTIGAQLRSLGIHINFAPVVDINTNPENPVIHDRSFGEDKQHVADCSLLFMRGLHDAGILSCAKHFPGHGNTSVDSHYDLPFVSQARESLEQCELFPFKKLIEHKVPAIMIAHLEIPAFENTTKLPSSLSKNIVTQLLENSLAFNGLKITDGLGMQAITDHFPPGDLELRAFIAGNDILLCPVDVPKAVELIKQAIRDGIICEDDINKKVMKILCVKEATCLQIPSSYDPSLVCTPRAQELKKQLFQEAITIAHDTKKLIPLAATQEKICCVIFNGNNALPFERAASPSIACCHYEKIDQPSLDALVDASSICVVSLFGLTKNARQQHGISHDVFELLSQLKKKGKKSVAVIFGTPYAVRLLKSTDACLVAYENDPDAQEAAAHILLGSLTARGILPVTVS